MSHMHTLTSLPNFAPSHLAADVHLFSDDTPLIVRSTAVFSSVEEATARHQSAALYLPDAIIEDNSNPLVTVLRKHRGLLVPIGHFPLEKKV